MTTPPVGPTEIVFLGDTVSGPPREKQMCFPTGERARHYAESPRFPLPVGWRYRECPHIPPGTAVDQ